MKARLARWWQRLRVTRIRAAVDDEIRFHIEERADALTAAGLSPEAAAARAKEEFGNRDEVRKSLTSIDRRMAARRWRTAASDVVRQDLRHAVRRLTAAPAFTLLVIATLTLAIGANGAIFSVIDRLFFRPPQGVGDPSGLVRLYHYRVDPSPRAPGWIHYPGFQGIVTHAPPDLSVTAYSASRSLIGRGESPPAARVAWVAPGYFSMLRVGAPTLGRYFTDREAEVGQSNPLVVISHAQWQARFGGNIGVIGATIELSRRPYTIVGVASRGFTGIDVDAVDYWAPMGSYRPGTWYRQTSGGVRVLVRAEGRSPGQIGEIATAGYRAAAPREKSATLVAAPLADARGPAPWSPEVTISTRLVGVAVVVLLIACANVANLLLSRTMQRRGEIAVRAALGASRPRLMRLFFVETLVLSLCAALASCFVSAWGGEAIRQLLLPEINWAGPVIDARVLAFTLAIALVAATLTGLPIAFQASRGGLSPALKTGVRAGGASRSPGRSALLIAQLALSLVLLVGAGAFVRSLLTVQSIQTGYDTEKLLLLNLRYDDGSFQAARTAELLEQALPRLRAYEGVESVALSGMDPLSGQVANLLFRADAAAIEPRFHYSYRTISPQFFRTAGVDLIRGRDLGPGDVAGAPPVMVINQAMAQGLWPGQDALGQCVRIGSAAAPCVSVVGIVENMHRDGLIEQSDEPAPMYFMPNAQSTGEFGAARTAIVRAAERRGVTQLAEALLADLRQSLPNGVYASVTPMVDTPRFKRELRPWVLGSTLFSAFGVLALVVAGVGTYSALAYSVSRRTREMGIRLALGAPPITLLRLVIADGMLPVVIGIGLGLTAANLASPVIAALLYETSPSDPIVIGVAVAVLAATAAFGILVPAHRATRVDPITVLRAE